ncbi:MAG: hypothetical protein NTY22_04500 [Proteobacteria bacterium]|nr:hypothetical protein [Pseudomonadota bacterium]
MEKIDIEATTEISQLSDKITQDILSNPIQFASLVRVFKILKDIRDRTNATASDSWITYNEYKNGKIKNDQ